MEFIIHKQYAIPQPKWNLVTYVALFHVKLFNRLQARKLTLQVGWNGSLTTRIDDAGEAPRIDF